MKLLAFGDLHLGASPDFGTAEHPRLQDQRRTLQHIAELVQKEQVGGVLFTGDAFHGRRPTPPQLEVWLTFVEIICGDLGIPLVSVIGNHDMAALAEVTAPELGRVLGHFPHRVPDVNYSIPGVAVACLPWAPIANLVAARNGGDRDALHAEAAQLLLQTARELHSHAPESPNILLTHFSISGAVTPTGHAVGPDFGVVLPRDWMQGLGFDFVVAGHIHKAQRLGGDNSGGEIIYTGSPGVVDWGEWDTPHGCWIIDTDHDDQFTSACRFVEIPDRPFVTIDLDLNDEHEADWLVDSAWIGYRNLKPGAIVRLRYTATAEQQRRIDSAAIRAALHAAGAARVFIQPTIIREERARVEGVDETLGPLEALQLYSEHQDLASDRRAMMAERTTRYLQEV